MRSGRRKKQIAEGGGKSSHVSGLAHHGGPKSFAPSLNAKQALKKLRKAGYRLDRDSSGHWLVFGAGDNPLVRLPGENTGKGKNMTPRYLVAIHRMLTEPEKYLGQDHD